MCGRREKIIYFDLAGLIVRWIEAIVETIELRSDWTEEKSVGEFIV